MVPNMAYKPPILSGGKGSHMGQIYCLYIKIKHEGTSKDPIEGHQKISKRATKDPY